MGVTFLNPAHDIAPPAKPAAASDAVMVVKGWCAAVQTRPGS
jgi:hypothetical protein